MTTIDTSTEAVERLTKERDEALARAAAAFEMAADLADTKFSCSGTDAAHIIRDAIRALATDQERDALAKVRAEAMREVVGYLREDNILSAAERTGYEPYEDRIAAQDRVAADAVKSFVGAKDETEALKMALRHAEDRIAAARNRILWIKDHIENQANQVEKGEA